jgi:PAS domain S-box-containing protein
MNKEPSSNDRFISTLESMTDGFVSFDKNWRYTYVNKRAADMFGRKPEELIGEQMSSEFPEGVRRKIIENYRKALELQTQISMEEFYPGKNRWIENRVIPSEDGISIFFQDVTERRRSEDLISGQKQLHEMIATAKPFRETLTALILFIESQAPDMTCTILLLDEDRRRLKHGAAPNFPEGLSAAIDGAEIGPNVGSCGTAAYRGEKVFVRDIATDPLWAEYKNPFLLHGFRACWSSPIFDERNRVLGTFAMYYREAALPAPHHLQLIGIATHIAAICIIRNRSEERLKRSEKQLGLIFDTVTDSIFLLEIQPNLRFSFVSVNKAFLARLGLQAEEVIGNSVESVFPVSIHQLIFDNYRKAVRERKAVQWEEKSAVVTVSPIFDSQGVCTNLVGVIHDAETAS